MRRPLPLAFLALSSLAYGLGLFLAERWYSLLIVAAVAAAWIIWGRQRPELCFAASILVAATGVALAAPLWCMIAGTAASLVLWDCADVSPAGTPSSPSPPEYRDYRRGRLPIAAIVVAIGTGIAIAGSGIYLDLNFYALVLCVVAVVIAADRIAARLRSFTPRSRE